MNVPKNSHRTQEENDERIPPSVDKTKELKGQSRHISEELRQIWHRKVVSEQCERHLRNGGTAVN